jgi:hypothetical protein
MGAFIGELRSRLLWAKTAIVFKVDSFVLAKPLSDDDNVNNEETSELRRVLALRCQAIAGSSYKFDLDKQPTTQTPRPLAPIQNRFVSGVFVGTQAPVSPKDVHHHLTPTDILSSQVLPRDDNDCNPPGADFTVTELVTTAFGTRRVRRLVIPPIAEGARPSRDPRIVVELKFLRAKQKVGGGAKADEVV